MSVIPAIDTRLGRERPAPREGSQATTILALKIGGSLFSDKSVENSLDMSAIADYARMVSRLFQGHCGRLVFITGGGALGHGALRGNDGADPFGCIPLTKALADVRWSWTEALRRQGVRALPLQLGAMSVLDDDGSFSVRGDVLTKVLDSGALPVLSGDSVLDMDGRLHGISSDRVPEFLVRALDADLRVVSLTDVPGILLDGPNGKNVLAHVDPAFPERAYSALWAKSPWDSTGALKTKLDALLACASAGAECFIMRGSAQGTDYSHLFSPFGDWPDGVSCTRISSPSATA
ncbi:hypothetical protein KGD83_08815 [Nocardiopsis akebiae]|uniref:Aspartate/glutamate/uridylate kinase domain-containing protein n=1 Tax=Nocardiopsis akebiae TaxID=2831968 RepID=A0ABX8C838_9ACTN|nr:hypothetical protein [Nocardiopsis akebiae]QUX30590.1 hypothetical protein KGD83_08815 [Nocardiopsis akebiae]